MVLNEEELLVWNTSGFILLLKIRNPSIDVPIDIAVYLKESGLPHIISATGICRKYIRSLDSTFCKK